MAKLAVIKTGGKQYLIKEGDSLKVEKLKDGEDFVFDQVLFLSDEKATGLKLGQPVVEGIQVKANVEAQIKDKKVRVVKYKNKTRYHKVYGHKQQKSKINILKIG